MASNNKSAKPAGTQKKTSFAGPHGGGVPYEQAKVQRGFMVHNPISGHTQKQNISTDVGYGKKGDK